MISINDLMNRNPWTVARENRLYYKSIHAKSLFDGGTFLDVSNWNEGYGAAVKILNLGDAVEVQTGTIQRLSEEGFKFACKSAGISIYDEMALSCIVHTTMKYRFDYDDEMFRFKNKSKNEKKIICKHVKEQIAWYFNNER